VKGTETYSLIDYARKIKRDGAVLEHIKTGENRVKDIEGSQENIASI
jgi:hypothetical protein